MSVRKRTWKTAAGETKEAWIVAYADRTGRHIETFERKKDADARHAEVKVNIKKGTHLAPSASITIAGAGEHWIKSAEAAGLERATIRNMRESLRLHISPLIGHMKLCDVDVALVKHFRDTLLKDRSAYTRGRAVQFLGSILADAMESKKVAVNAVRMLRKVRGQKRHSKKLEIGVDIPRPDEITRHIQQQSGLRERALIIMLAFTGIRVSEARGLRWQDVDLNASELHVRQRADRFNQIGSPKSEHSRRTVPFGKVVCNSLKEWKLACPKTELDLVFPAPHGGPIFREALGQRFVNFDGWKYKSFHSLRHFYASWCINPRESGGLGLPPKVVQERLGHATLAMTMDRYGHLFPRGDDSALLDQAELAVISGSR